ncbi:hypothetical protein BGZ94_005572 [Podila epigama]|nr:hypothetical protein BGZ94_005572 [Podila epigama]
MVNEHSTTSSVVGADTGHAASPVKQDRDESIKSGVTADRATQRSSYQPKPPVVLIVGAGLGGLLLGMLLEKANIEYFIFERAQKVKPLGSAMALNANIMPVFEQLGMVDELMKIAFPCHSLDLYKESLKPIGALDVTFYKQVTGYETILFARSDLYNIMLSKIPPNRIFHGKKVLSIRQDDESATIHCSDNSEYCGDILIGADGAYSGVRQSLYKQLNRTGDLPAPDREEMPMSYVCMVGTTGELSPEKYPELKSPISHFATVLAKNRPLSCTTVTVPGNKAAWSVMIQLGSEEAKDMMFRNSEWGPDANKTMIEQIRDFPVKLGGVLGDLIDATDKDLISKVYIEEKIFLTWTHGRTALMGDAVHKMQPSAGQGAVNAMQDAVILANCIYDIENVTYENIQAALASYKAQRFAQANFQMRNSKLIGKLLFGQKRSERIMRNIVYNLPKFLQSKNHFKAAVYRPQIAFLPRVPNTTNLALLPQEPSKRYAREQAAKAQAI